jgi:hypothetical protein
MLYKILNVVLDIVTESLYIYTLTSLLDFKQYDYFHIHMDFVLLYRSTEWQ